MRKSVIVLVSLTLALALSTTASARQPKITGLSECLHLRGHVYEVCYAYVFNSSAGALYPYYQFGSSTNHARAEATRNRLESRYYSSARNIVVKRTASWPKGSKNVSLPHIKIVSVSTNLGTNTAMLTTRESWLVATESGQVLYSEKNKTHNIIMRRVPGLFLHKWVVVSGI